MAKYRKKPIIIEAKQFLSNILPWPQGVEVFQYCSTDPGDFCHIHEKRHLKNGYRIQTLEGPLNVSDGDWIITGIQGERYPCKPDIFEATYESVEEIP